MAIKINGATVIDDLQAFTSTSTVSATGNITGGNIRTGGVISATGNLTAANMLTGGIISATGNITSGGTITATTIAGNVTSTGPVSTTGNVTGGNIVTGGLISATGTITGGTFSGAGTNLTGTAASLTVGTATVAGTVTTAAQPNITSVGTLTSLSSSGNVVSSNMFTGGVVSASGNVTGGNILTAGRISATGDLFGANAVFAGNLTVDGNITYINSNVVTINDLAINLANNAATAAAANGGGIEVGPAGSPYITFTYNSGANTMTSSAGLSAVGNVVGANFVTSGQVSATGNIHGGNLNVSGGVFATSVISATGNIRGGNINTSGNINGGNVLFDGGVLSGTGNITGGNLSVGAGNITGGNLSVGTGTVTLGNIVNANGNGVGNIGSSSNYFNTIFAQATSAQYADLAEKYTADADYAPGTVVCFGGDQEVTICTADACRRVAGVISTNPSYIMNGTLSAAHVATVALTGRVPTRVTGTVRKGDLMVAAGNGAARAEADPKVGSVIGKALADHDGAEGVIEVVIGRF